VKSLNRKGNSMTQESFDEFLKITGIDEGTRIFALNCFEYGKIAMRDQLIGELKKMPMNDTASSLAVWISEQQ
jgi:hypothetical protein